MTKLRAISFSCATARFIEDSGGTETIPYTDQGIGRHPYAPQMQACCLKWKLVSTVSMDRWLHSNEQDFLVTYLITKLLK